MEKFKVGDLVTPVFGGPIMQVVSAQQSENDKYLYTVEYFLNGNTGDGLYWQYQLAKVKRTLTMVNDVVEVKFELDPTEEERERFGLIKTTSTIWPPKYVELNKEFRFGPNEPQF